MGPREFTFYDVIERNAVRFKKKNAWMDSEIGITLTFGDYKERVDRLAKGLQIAGIEKGDRIAILGKNSIEYFMLYGAGAALGAIILPINWRLSYEEIEYNLRDCEPKLIFVESCFQEGIKGLMQKIEFVEDYFNIGSEDGEFSNFEALMGYGNDFTGVDVATDEDFVIMYTAAVVGKARGAILSHGNVLCADMHFSYLYNMTPQDVYLSFLPLFHVSGLMMVTSCFFSGAMNINMRKFDAGEALKLIEEEKVSVSLVFSPILSSILEEQEKSGRDMSSLRAVCGLEGREAIERYENISGGSFYNAYGQTETSALATFGLWRDKPGSAGTVLPLAQMRLVDDHDAEVSLGQVGEITVKGPMVFKGYWNLEKETEYAFRKGWHHTGDIGRFDEDGYLWYEGRKEEKELIKPGGENVYPAEVEKVILEHPAVENTVVFGVPDPKWKEGIKAVCVLRKGHKLKPEELIDFVGNRIARYKKPHYVEFVPDFPLLDDEKLDRSRIKKEHGG